MKPRCGNTAGFFHVRKIGGSVGAIIDHNKGTGYNYPDQLPVEMGKSVVVDRKVQDAPPVASK